MGVLHPAERARRGATAVLLVMGAAGVGAARADTEACVAAYDKNQRQRRAGELIDARRQLLLCSRGECPEVIRNECTRWLAEVEAAIPTVVLAAKDESGHDVTSVRVEVDGKLVQERLDGRALPVDPGTRVIRWLGSGGQVIEREVLIREAEKRRLIEVQFVDQRRHPFTQPVIVEPAPVEARAPVQDEEVSRPIPTEAWVLGGIGAVGLAGFGYFGWRSWWEADDLQDSCAPNCDESDVDAARTKALIADISLGVAVIGAAGAAYFVVVDTGPDRSRRGSTKAVVGPGWTGLIGSF